MEAEQSDSSSSSSSSSTKRRLAVTLIVCLVAVYNIFIRQHGDNHGLNSDLFQNGLIEQKNETAMVVVPQEPSNVTSPLLPKCLIYLHVPKVGGRTIGSFLDQILEHPKVRHFAKRTVYGEQIAWNPQDLHSNFMLIGHFTTKVFKMNPNLPKDCFVMTVLREPVDRAISAFFFHGHRTTELERCLSNSSDTRKRCKLYWQYSNDMTRYFAGTQEVPWNTYWMGGRGSKVVPEPTNTSLHNAKQGLNDYFDLVCFLHDLPTCAERLMSAFALNGNIDVSTMTKNKQSQFKTKARPDDLGSADLQTFQKANAIDKNLFEWARAHFQSNTTTSSSSSGDEDENDENDDDGEEVRRQWRRRVQRLRERE